LFSVEERANRKGWISLEKGEKGLNEEPPKKRDFLFFKEEKQPEDSFISYRRLDNYLLSSK